MKTLFLSPAITFLFFFSLLNPSEREKNPPEVFFCPRKPNCLALKFDERKSNLDRTTLVVSKEKVILEDFSSQGHNSELGANIKF